jgi:Domain of unknown function (DUF5060)/Domain of unknown function (DUF5605)/Protein of unknown function (DUF4038)
MSLVALASFCAGRPARATMPVEQWGMFELVLKGPSSGNPYADVRFSAQFFQERGSIEVLGFYDGHGLYRVRFMPPKPGLWHYTTVSSAVDLEARSGDFTVGKPLQTNHGPVRIAHTFHFAYADGKPYEPIGTTCAACAHQGDAAAAKTLKSLAASPFNKVRLTVFPARDDLDHGGPSSTPFEGAPGHLDTQRLNPKFFQKLERQISNLGKLGIEADVILHPDDQGRSGVDRVTPVDDDNRYVDYVMARLSAFRNVWWSLANDGAVDRRGKLVSADDVYHHLLSIHGQPIANQNRPWTTHLCIPSASSSEDVGRGAQARAAYHKPIVLDEVEDARKPLAACGSPCDEETVSRFWEATVAGAYADYGENHSGTDESSWWSKAGVLKARGPARLAFLRRALEKGPAEGIEPIGDARQHPRYGGQPARYTLVYFGKDAPTSWAFQLASPPPGGASPNPLADGMKLSAEVLDTWNMTITPVDGPFTLKKGNGSSFVDKDHRSIALPGRPYMAVRIKSLPPQ